MGDTRDGSASSKDYPCSVAATAVHPPPRRPRPQRERRRADQPVAGHGAEGAGGQGCESFWAPAQQAEGPQVASSTLLLERGQISEEQLAQAKQVEAQTPGKTLAQILLTMNAASEAQILSALAETLGAPVRDARASRGRPAGVRPAPARLHPQAPRPAAALRGQDAGRRHGRPDQRLPARRGQAQAQAATSRSSSRPGRHQPHRRADHHQRRRHQGRRDHQGHGRGRRPGRQGGQGRRHRPGQDRQRVARSSASSTT